MILRHLDRVILMENMNLLVVHVTLQMNVLTFLMMYGHILIFNLFIIILCEIWLWLWTTFFFLGVHSFYFGMNSYFFFFFLLFYSESLYQIIGWVYFGSICIGDYSVYNVLLLLYILVFVSDLFKKEML